MCMSLLTIMFIVCTRAEATCVQQFITASALSAWVAPFLLPQPKKKSPKKKGPCVIVKVLLLTGEIHLAT